MRYAALRRAAFAVTFYRHFVRLNAMKMLSYKEVVLINNRVRESTE
jgi:hypothetical protein